jgi:RimJ/RimL family protein N-acetyltransferase
MRLVPITADDLWLSEAFEGDPEFMVHLGGPRSKEKIAEVHQRRLDDMARGTVHMFKILRDDADEPMGTIGFWETEHDGEKVHEMGWFVRREYQGRGIATEAGRLLLEKAREVPRVTVMYAFPPVTNEASNAICRKLGFELVGVMEGEFDGRPVRWNDWRLDLRTSASGSPNNQVPRR